MSERVRLPQTAERVVFGGGGEPRRHPATGTILENGIGAAPDDVQAKATLDRIARQEGEAAVAPLRKKLGDYMSSKAAALAVKTAQEKAAAAKAQVIKDGIPTS
jgi:hypothetical protein